MRADVIPPAMRPKPNGNGSWVRFRKVARLRSELITGFGNEGGAILQEFEFAILNRGSKQDVQKFGQRDGMYRTGNQ